MSRIEELLGEGPYAASVEIVFERVRAVLDLLESWEATRWRKDGRESEWTRLMIREVREALDGGREVGR